MASGMPADPIVGEFGELKRSAGNYGGGRERHDGRRS